MISSEHDRAWAAAPCGQPGQVLAGRYPTILLYARYAPSEKTLPVALPVTPACDPVWMQLGGLFTKIFWQLWVDNKAYGRL